MSVCEISRVSTSSSGHCVVSPDGWSVRLIRRRKGIAPQVYGSHVRVYGALETFTPGFDRREAGLSQYREAVATARQSLSDATEFVVSVLRDLDHGVTWLDDGKWEFSRTT